MQFECICAVPPIPFESKLPFASAVGVLEDDDLGIKPAPAQAQKDVAVQENLASAEKRIADHAASRAAEVAKTGVEHILGIPAESISEADETRVLTIAADPCYHSDSDWVLREPEGPRRQRTYVPSAAAELDEHQRGKSSGKQKRLT